MPDPRLENGGSSPDPSGLAEVGRGEKAGPLAHRVEVEDLELKLHAVRRREKRHLLWMVLGVSPAAVIPALGLLREGSTDLLLLLLVLVAVVHTVAWNRAAREAERLEKELQGLLEGEDPPLPQPEVEALEKGP